MFNAGDSVILAPPYGVGDVGTVIRTVKMTTQTAIRVRWSTGREEWIADRDIAHAPTP